jgi:hypothetical protein
MDPAVKEYFEKEAYKKKVDALSEELEKLKKVVRWLVRKHDFHIEQIEKYLEDQEEAEQKA